MQQSIRERWCVWIELAASISWFAMDYAWFEESGRTAVVLALPTAVGALLVVPLTTPSATARLVAGSMASWAVMNSFWMMHDLGVLHLPWLIRACFVLGALQLLLASALGGRLAGLARELIAGFGRLRVPW